MIDLLMGETGNLQVNGPTGPGARLVLQVAMLATWYQAALGDQLQNPRHDTRIGLGLIGKACRGKGVGIGRGCD